MLYEKPCCLKLNPWLFLEKSAQGAISVATAFALHPEARTLHDSSDSKVSGEGMSENGVPSGYVKIAIENGHL
jgi:hypothetical protein